MKEVCKNCVCYNDGWCEAFVVQKLPNTKGCFGFIPNDEKDKCLEDDINIVAEQARLALGMMSEIRRRLV